MLQVFQQLLCYLLHVRNKNILLLSSSWSNKLLIVLRFKVSAAWFIGEVIDNAGSGVILVTVAILCPIIFLSSGVKEGRLGFTDDGALPWGYGVASKWPNKTAKPVFTMAVTWTRLPYGVNLHSRIHTYGSRYCTLNKCYCYYHSADLVCEVWEVELKVRLAVHCTSWPRCLRFHGCWCQSRALALKFIYQSAVTNRLRSWSFISVSIFLLHVNCREELERERFSRVTQVRLWPAVSSLTVFHIRLRHHEADYINMVTLPCPFHQCTWQSVPAVLWIIFSFIHLLDQSGEKKLPSYGRGLMRK